MGRNARELKEAIKNIANKEVEGETKGQILENLNKQYVDVALTIGVVDASGDDIAGATVTLKKGAVVGSGDTVTANENGTYTVNYGKYNYSVEKSGYTTGTGTVDVTYADADNEAKIISVELTA